MMRRGLPFLLALLAAAAPAAAAAAPAPGPAALAGWIDALAELDSLATGLSPTHGGLDFPPVAGQLDWSVALLGQGRPQRRNEALEKPWSRARACTRSRSPPTCWNTGSATTPAS